MRRRSPWTQAEIDEFVTTHEATLREWAYPEEIVTEFRRARERWLAGVRRV